MIIALRLLAAALVAVSVSVAFGNSETRRFVEDPDEICNFEPCD